jgi:hypothetical protein
MLYRIIRGAIEGSPRKLAIVGLIMVMFGTCPGVALFDKYGFVNPLLVFFYVVALLTFLLALFKYLAWIRDGATRALPNQGVLLQLDHVFQVTERDRPMLGVRERTTRFATQPVVLMPPATGSQKVSVACSTCQQEASFHVDSLPERRRRRLSTVLFSGIMIAIAVALGIVSSHATQAVGWVAWARIGFLILLLCGTIGLGTLFSYVGARYAGIPRGHKVRHPEKDEIISFRYKVGQFQQTAR